MIDWRKLTPIYDDTVSVASLIQRKKLYEIAQVPLRSVDLNAPHWHESYELGYVLGGSGFHVFGDREYRMEAGQVYVINDYSPHMGYADPTGAELFVVHFHPGLLDNRALSQFWLEAHAPFSPEYSFKGSPLIPLNDPVTEPVRHLLEQIRIEHQDQQQSWEIVVAGLLLQAIGLLSRRQLSTRPELIQDLSHRNALIRIKPIMEMIEHRYMEPLTLDEIADTMNLSRSRCSALFKIALNTSPIAYRNTRRLAEAKRLLQFTDMNVNEIGYAVGFSSPQELNRLFNREYDLTPTQFRAQILK